MGRRRYRGRPDWAQGKEVLWEVLTGLGEEEPDVGFLKFIGKGLFYSVLYTEIELGGEPVDVVVRVPRSDVGDDQPGAARRAVAVREALLDRELPFEVARSFGCADSDHGLAVVDEWVSGRPLDEKLPQKLVDPVEVTAIAAAGCHGVEPDDFRELLPGFATRRAHAESVLELLEEEDSTVFADARQWVKKHLPPDTPSRLVHGDLLGQNILVHVDWQDPDDWSATVIDWDAAQMGDPAYDLAIVSRGHRKVFRDGQSLQQLVDAYNERAEEPVDIAHVRIYELWLKARLYLSEVEESGQSAHAEQLLTNLDAVLRRCRE